ncbi:MarR family transcriptional regulator [Streptomyces sp. NPDC086554]|uniref:MarR family winged helix-turn-helix transcriptional regulator n=1 Tax=Streptomyces sp. NPDC086554 TaxID=3154864 RepID=UPI00342567E4
MSGIDDTDGIGEDAKAERTGVQERLTSAGRENSAATVMFHSAVAARQGLSATESKTLDLLERGGPLTAKDLAERTTLAPASVTGLVDRLENKGFVRRKREVDELCEEFTVDELETVTRFLQGATERRRRATARLAE